MSNPPGQDTPTPGPWSTRKIGEHILINSAGDLPVCEVAMWNDADAALIAASPLLLAALKNLAQTAKGGMQPAGAMIMALKEADAVIAKIEGEQTT